MSESRKALPNRSYRSLIAVAAISLLGLLATAGFKSVGDLRAARELERRLERQIAESEARIRVLRHDVHSIERDRLTLERLAREELGMVKPNDVVIVLPEAAEEDRPAPDRGDDFSPNDGLSPNDP